MFELWEESQYRALDADGIEERRAAILGQLEGESSFTVEELRSQVEMLEAEIERRNAAVQLRSAKVAAVQGGEGALIARSAQAAAPEAAIDAYDTAEYRTAFKDYMTRGIEIPVEYRASEATKTDDAAAVIPTTLMNRIIRELDTYGNIWAKVTKTNFKGGVDIPTASVKPTAKWIGEGAGEDQKLTADECISFKYHGLEVKLAQTFLAATVTLSAFEDEFTKLAAEAMVKAIEAAIIAGDGNGKFLGITQDPRVTKVVTISSAEVGDWSAWHKLKAAMKKAYRNGDLIMAQSTFDMHIDGMVDKNGQPIARVNYGINGEETYRFMGKTVETVEEDLIKDFDSASEGDVIAIFGRLSDYMVNSNMQITATKWRDEDNNLIKNKLLMYADGKVADPYGFILVKKGAEA